MVSSLLHHCAKFDIANLNCEKKFSESQVYFCSKLANIMITNELAKKLKGTGRFYASQYNFTRNFVIYTANWYCETLQSRRLCWSGHVTKTEGNRNHIQILLKKLL
jgi:hypothetical protein